MPFVNVHCCTWNVGGNGPPEDSLECFLGVADYILPDVIAVALQEVREYNQWRKVLIKDLKSLDYVLIKERNCWAISIFAFVKRSLLLALTNIESEVTPSGYGGFMGNKGGVSIRFELFGVNMIFLSCHFTAHKENKRERLNDYYDIINHQRFRDEDVHVILDHDYVFWMGDLNFRLEGVQKSDVEELVRTRRFEELLSRDQLNIMKKNKLIFHNFSEGLIDFPPTFKFDKGTDVYDSSKKQRVPAWTDRILYMVNRDFALDHHLTLNKDFAHHSSGLFSKIPVRGLPSEVTEKFPSTLSSNKTQYPEVILIKYTSLETYKFSDHRPVIGVFDVIVPSRWFALPVQFEEPSQKAYRFSADLIITYRILDPPGLLNINESNSIQSPKVISPANLLLYKVTGELESQKMQHTVNSALPEVINTGAFDWIGLYPSNFSDFHNDCITYVYASSNVSGKRHHIDPSESVLTPPQYFKLKLDSNYLKNVIGRSLCLIYISCKKKCPQGYSREFTIRE